MSIKNYLKEKYNESSTVQKVGVGAATVVTALALHPILIVGAVVGGASTAGVVGYNKFFKGPQQ